MFRRYFSSERVRNYYNEWDDRYEQSYGSIIQAFRPAGDEQLIDYLLQSLSIMEGGHYLDAGCGVGGVAIPFVKKSGCRITGITISDKQVERASERVDAEGLNQKINIIRGDFHHMSEYFEPHTFDGIYFMESLGHAHSPEKVLKQAIHVLKPGGFIYIKDFYVRESASFLNKMMFKRVIKNINRHYRYQVMDLHKILSCIRKSDVKLNFIKSFDFADDISIRSDFESKNEIDLFDGKPEIMPADWYEIKFTKY